MQIIAPKDVKYVFLNDTIAYIVVVIAIEVYESIRNRIKKNQQTEENV